MYIFDVLARDDESICHLPLEERRVHIKDIIDGEVMDLCQSVEIKSEDAEA